MYHRALQGISPAFANSGHEPEEWLLRCAQDTAQLWSNGDFWLLTEVRKCKGGIGLHIVGAAGTLDESLINEAEEWAKSIGCIKSFYTGRRGWLRRMPEYKLVTVTAEKELTWKQ